MSLPATVPPAGRRLVIKSGAGTSQPERCAQALTVAATAVAAGTSVTLWLIGDAVDLARPGVAEDFVLEHAAPLAGLRDAVRTGGTLIVCTQCAARRGLTADDLLPEVIIAGAASYVEQILEPDVQAIVY